VITCPTVQATYSNDNGQCFATIDGLIATAEDLCSDIVSITNDSGNGGADASGEYAVGVHTITFVATDAAGNTAECSVTFEVVDDENPVIECPEDVVIDTDGNITSGAAGIVSMSSDGCGVVIQYAAPQGTDNCPLALTTHVSGLGTGPNFYAYGGVYTETWMVTDAAGNTAECSFTITVEDNASPTITCPVDLTVANDPGECGAVVTYANPRGSDNCPGFTFEQVAGLPSGSSFPLGTTTVA
jgi:hypothetical protein